MGSFTISDETHDAICNLFELMAGLFPSMHAALNCESNIRFTFKAWVWALYNAGIILQDGSLDMALWQRGKHCLPFFNNQFMPSCGQFIHLCLHGREPNATDKGTVPIDNL